MWITSEKSEWLVYFLAVGQEILSSKKGFLSVSTYFEGVTTDLWF